MRRVFDKGFLGSPWLGRYAGLVLAWLLACSIKMGDTGLWDPWETHYGEVARNIITRGDPMDLRYKPGYGPDGLRENQFRSKHALPFWGMAAGLWIFDSGDGPREDEMVASARPLWALRLPSMLMALWGVGALALAVHRCVSPRAGWICAFVLATTPQFVMMARQATTDIYALAPMCVALGAWLQVQYGPDRPLGRRSFLGLSLPWDRAYVQHALLWGLVVLGPIALLWRHVSSARIVEMVAQWPDKPSLPKVEDLEQIAQAMSVYAAIALLLFAWTLRAKTRRELQVYTMYLVGGWALMGKGLLVPGLLAVVFLADLWRRGAWTSLGELRPFSGVLAFFLACAPWHHAMAIFRGNPWVHELLIENNLERFLSGEQVQATGDLGYYLGALLFAAGVWIFVWPSTGQGSQAPKIQGFALQGFALSLGVISVSATKYDHYTAVCLPFLALCVTGWFARDLASVQGVAARERGLWVIGLVFLGASVLHYLFLEPAKMVHLTTYLSTGIWREGAGNPLFYALTLGAACGIRCAYLLWPQRAWLQGAFLGVAMASTWVLMLQYLPQSSKTWSQAGVMRSYFAQRSPNDEIASWWFYHRGETFYTKRKIWVQATPDPKVLRDKIKQMQQKPGDLWILTNPLHQDRLRSHLPASLRDKLTQVDARTQQVLFKLPLNPSVPGE